MQIEHEELLVDSLHRGANLFLGSGFSILATDSDGNALPVGKQLNSEICEKFGKTGLESLELAQLCTIVRSTLGTELDRFFQNRFKVAAFDEKYHVLENYPWEAIFTTNVDDLVYEVFRHSKTRYINNNDVSGPSYHDKLALDYIPLHGTIRNTQRGLRFSAAELASAFASDPDRWRFLTRQINRTATLFWGYGVHDAGTLQAIDTEGQGSNLQKDRWILVRSEASRDGSVDYFRALRFNIIEGDTAGLLTFLRDVRKPELPLSITTHSVSSRFSFELIPSPSQVPVRPVLDFFLGASPQWSDIYSGSLFATSHYARLRNAISGQKHVIVTGVPACGKTTLLMRAAAEMDFPGIKLILQSPTLANAINIVERLEGQRALIFIDEFAEMVDSTLEFASHSNIKVVAADREYNLRNIRHRLGSNFNVLSVTELAPVDIEGCLKSIPQNVRAAGSRKRGASGEEWSLFEVIESNVSSPTLRERFTQVLRELKEQDPSLRDLLLMFSYVQTCRTPVSMDMIVAFMREVTKDYGDLLTLCDKLGQLIREYKGELAEAAQDYFMPRSTLLAQSVIDSASSKDLRELLIRFHNEVSSYRICRFDIFKKHGFDADLMRRAFNNWEEGLAFYESLFARDESAAMLQQCALYLSHKERYSEAFRMIDRALLKTGGRSSNIRNSHAIILFEANIRFAGQADADMMLKKSMSILTECYTSDKRTIYHAMRYSNQAIRICEVLGEEEAGEYLATASKWMRAECQKAPWDRGARAVLNRLAMVSSQREV